MRNWLLLLIFILPYVSLTQKESVIRPFEDYKNCTTGFINTNGDTIWPAKFTQVMHPYSHIYQQSNCWAVTFEGKIGLLSPSGKLLLPFEYSRLDMTHKYDVFFAEKEGKIGVINAEGKEIFPFEIDRYTPYEKFDYLIIKDGKLGIIDSALRVKIQPEFDEIEFELFQPYVEGDNYLEHHYFYLLKNNGLYGLAKFDGTILFKDGKYPFTVTENPDRRGLPLLYLYGDDSHIGLSTIRNEMILEPEYLDISTFSLIDKNEDSVFFALTENASNERQVINLKTKSKSKPYEDILFGSHTMIYRKGKKQGVLDTELKEYPVKSTYELRYTPPNSYYEESEYGINKLFPFHLNSSSESVLTIADVKHNKRYTYGDYKGFGLYHFQSGKMVKPHYKSILHKSYKGQNYYFAIKPSSQNIDSGYLEIYNSDLTRLGKFDFNYLTANNFNEFFNCHRNCDSVLILQNHQNKVGGIFQDGKQSIPFIYDNIYYYYGRDYGYDQRKLQATIGDKNGYIDWNGKELIPVKYKILQPFQNGFTIAGNPNDYVLFDSVNNPVITDCELIAHGSPRNLKNYYFNNAFFLRDIGFFAAKGGFVYAYYPKEGFKLLDQQNYHYDERFSYELINNHFLVDKTGKCYLYKDFIGRETDKIYWFANQDTLCIYHVDKGVTISAPRSHLKHVYDGYIHVVQDNKKEGIISRESAEWILELGSYSQIISEKKNKIHPNHDNFWCIKGGDEQLPLKMWSYYQVDKGSFLERKFDLASFSVQENYLIARSDGAFGLLDSNYNQVIPFEYLNIFYSEGIFFLKGKDRLWYAWTVKKGIVPLKCRDVSLSAFKKGRLIFDGNLVGILSSELELVQPLATTSDIKRGKSLKELLGDPIFNPVYLNWATSLIQDEDSLGRLINNFTIIDLSLINSTRHQITEMTDEQYRSYQLQPIYLDPVYLLRQESKRIDFKGKKFCSYTLLRKKIQFNESIRYGRFDHLAHAQLETIRTTLILDGDDYREAHLSELFKVGFNYDLFLDQRLSEIITRKQLFGITCLNLPQVLEEYKANFHLVKEGLQFSLKDGSKAVNLSWKELSDHLNAL